MFARFIRLLSPSAARRGAPRLALLLAAFSATAALATAQCATQWVPTAFGSGLNGDVKALLTMPNGDLIVGGDFTTAGGTTVNCIARWDGASWSAMGGGVSGGTSGTHVAALQLLPSGDLLVGGDFATAGTSTVHNVARWNGVAWSALGSGLSGLFSPANVSALLALPNGDVLASGYFVIGSSNQTFARWNGSSWSHITGVTGINVLMAMSNGSVIGGSSSPTLFGPAGAVWRLNGSSWSSLGSCISAAGSGMATTVSVGALAQLPNGDLIVGGDFISVGGTPANRIARWDGASWHALGSGMNNQVYALTTLPNGDVVAAGQFTTAGGVAASRIARWNGTSWSALGAGLGGNGLALTLAANGDLIAGGSFLTAGGTTEWRLARLTTTCPATVTSYGTGCTGSNGQLSLTADNLPWVGNSFRATAHGLVPGSIAAAVIGFTPQNTPLSALHPTGGLGCDLLASIDATILLFPTAGSESYQFSLGTNPALAGMPLRNQVVQVELDPQFSITGVTSTNALTVRVGAF